MSPIASVLRRFRQTTFRRQLTLLSAVGVLCISLFTALATSWQGSRQIRANLLQEGERIALSLAAQSRLALVFGSTENVAEAVSAASAFPDVTRIEIFHADGRLLLARGPGPEAVAAGNAPAAPLADSSGHPFLEFEDADGLRFVAPVLARPGPDSPFEMTERRDERLGFVRVYQGKETLTRLVREVFLVNFAAGLLFSLVFLFAVRVLARRLTQPLATLSGTMARAERGESGLRADLSGPRDLSEMAHAFNSMMEALESREAELRTARDAALRFARLKADFAATVSHEIRTPLNGVIGTLDMLKAGQLRTDQRELLELAWDSSQYLLELINNILDFSRLEAGRLQTETTDFALQPLLDGVRDMFRSEAGGKGLLLTFQIDGNVPPVLRGDPARIRQVLINLVGNALKFTHHGSVVVRVARQPGERLHFGVRDTGIGLAGESMGAIFDSFTQADPSTTRRYGGSGLGLAICKQIVRLLGGEIGVESTPGQGSLFWFTLPCVAGSVPVAGEPPRPPAAGGHVLIVEDNRTNQVVAAGMLRLLGCTSGIAGNGIEAVTAWRAGGWDLILMDCAMPEMDGYQATASIRSAEAGSGQRIPIIAMTANTQAIDVEKCLAAGMDDHLGKPLTLDALSAKLAHWLHWQAPPEDGSGDGRLPLDAGVLARLREALGNALGEAVRPFLEDMPAYLRELEQALADDDALTLRRIAHVIKGAAGNLGASALAGVAREIELHAEAGALAASRPLLTQLRTEFALVEPVLAGEAGIAQEGTGVAEPAQESVDLPLPAADAPVVLIVDDDRSTRSALRHALRRGGFRVEEAGDGMAAMAWLERGIADAILMDALMPTMDGFETCAALKRHGRFREVPVLMITALEDRQSIERAFEAGASDFIPKPIHLSVVNQRVRRVIEANRAERHVRQLAYQDTLTGLPNRPHFIRRLEHAIERHAARNALCAVLFLDLDRFKFINDSLGHEAGDRLLVAMAQRLRSCVRADDCVARLGGDEFTLLLEDLPTPAVAASVAQNIGRTLSAPLNLDGQEIFVTASVGISLYPADGGDVSTLLRHADSAMYRAKQSGAGFSYYEATMESEVSGRLQLENALRRALERDEITVFYQPVIDTASGGVVGVEALVRWHHPGRGIVSPVEFIPVAEDTGLIVPLGERVLRQACCQARAWLDAGLPELHVAVNLSARQLEQENLRDVVLSALADSGLPPAALVLEITESVLMQRAREPVGVLHDLRALGVRIAIDDFGTGYSSLAYLKHLPADTLKIDRSFIVDLPGDDDAASIVSGIVVLAHKLRMKVVAEGVETVAQRECLAAIGCDTLQGYLFSRPLPAELAETLLQRAATH